MLEKFTKWVLDLLKELFSDLWDFVADALIAVFDLFLGAFVALIAAIPVPSFLSGGLGGVFGQLDGGVLWLVSQAGLPQGLSIIGAAYAFRVARKFLTLFQW